MLNWKINIEIVLDGSLDEKRCFLKTKFAFTTMYVACWQQKDKYNSCILYIMIYGCAVQDYEMYSLG